MQTVRVKGLIRFRVIQDLAGRNRMNTYVEWVLLPKSPRKETFTTKVFPYKNDTTFQLTDQAILVHRVIRTISERG
jgi:hypothetical protein